jgi:3-deoxy-D-manno-octulosonic-acid transferase
LNHAEGSAERWAANGSPPSSAPRRPLGRLFLALLADACYLAASPFLFIYLLLVSRLLLRPKFRRGFLQKLGGVPPRRSEGRRALWLHAVSVGEVETAVPLVEEIAARLPGWEASLSVSTYTGFEVARRRFQDLEVFYAPLDLSFTVGRALRRRRPAAIILLELEVWPNFLLGARRRGVPVFVANGRMTERSCRRYERAGGIGRLLFRQLSACAVQNEVYAERFRRVGVAPERLEVLGNLKHDRRPSVAGREGSATRERLGWGDSLVLVAGSTHPGEEALLCALLPRLRALDPRLRLVLAPRHIERLVSPEEERWGCDRPLVRWSTAGSVAAGGGLGDSVLLVDTVGELERFYAAADLVVVGGSLVPHGGHNLLEPARLGKPTCFGPHCENFREEADHLLRRSAALQVAGAAELEGRLGELLRDPLRRQQLGERARQAVLELAGASQRHVSWLERQLRLFLPQVSG